MGGVGHEIEDMKQTLRSMNAMSEDRDKKSQVRSPLKAQSRETTKPYDESIYGAV